MDHRGAIDLTGVSSFKKGEQPHKGEGMGAWSGLPDRSLTFKLGLGSEAILGFDTSTLTLDDFESMRFHPQVNASLTALTFMIHQADWHVECEDKRIKEMVEENLRAIWTRLIRSVGSALWAGYSPAILEFENDAQGRYTIINKVKDLHPAEAKVKWKKHDGVVAGRQRSWYTFDGIDQIGWGHIPALNSFWYPLLMEQGDMSGRKLLRAAFMPWYFSLVMHIYTNRYFERFGEPLPVGRAPFEETIVEPDGKSWTGKQLMETMLINLRNRGAVVLPSDRDSSTGTGAQAYTWDIDYLECVDTETEILTDQGWKSYDQLKVGDMALTLNHETGMSEFQSVDKVNIHQVEDREMLCMEGATHSSVTTMNHRWPVVGPKEKYRDWRFSGELQRRDRIPLIADRVDFPVDPKYDDAMVEAIAWYWAEGHTYQRDGKPINYISITQKRFPERIRSALTRLFGPAVESFPRNTWTNERSGVPMWRENFKKPDESIRQFFLNYEASELLQSVAPDRIVTYDFINSLTKSQLDLYIDTALAADGNQTAAQSFLMQKDKRKAEMFQYACTLAGHATSIYSQPDKRHEDYVMWIVSIRRRRYLHPKNAVNTGNAFTMTTKKHTGIVWCPTTRNATWLARRRGTVYFTGNSQMRGVDFERYLTRLDEEISLALFTPLLLMRNADVGSHNLGVQHVQCVHPDTKILCADLIWRPAKDLKAGQEIVAFDEDVTGEGRGNNARCYRTATIEGNMLTEKASMRLTTDIGDPIEASIDHPWLVWRRRLKAEHGNSNMGLVWVETKDLVVGDQIAYFGKPWVREESRDAGWLAGIFDGEGTLVINRTTNQGRGRNLELTISQNEGPIWDRIRKLLVERGFTFSESNPPPTGYGSGRCMKLRISGGFPEVMRFLGTIGPERLMEKAMECYEGRGLRKGYSYELATVTSIEDIGMNPISSIRTSGGTFITEGYLSHNTWLWFLNALLGDMKEYVDRYICERLKAINFSEKAPRCEWVPKKLGKENVDTVRAIATELLRQGIAKPDLEQMGTALGMDLTEIRQVQPTNPNAPQEDDRDRTERDRSTDGPGGVGSSPTPGSRTGTLAARISQNLWGTWSSGTVQISPLTATEIMHWGQKATNVQSALETLNGMDAGDFESPGDVVMIAAKVIGAIEAA